MSATDISFKTFFPFPFPFLFLFPFSRPFADDDVDDEGDNADLELAADTELRARLALLDDGCASPSPPPLPGAT